MRRRGYCCDKEERILLLWMRRGCYCDEEERMLF
jgi:hypothetical protein